MNDLVFPLEGEFIRGIAQLELPRDVALNARGLKDRLVAATERSSQASRELARTNEIPAWKLWRRGDKDRAISEALSAAQDFQHALTDLGVYNIWLSKAVHSVQSSVSAQNQRIEAQQAEISARLSKADDVLKMVNRAGEELARQIESADRETEAISKEAERARGLLETFREQAEALNAQVERTARLDKEMREGFNAAHALLDQHAASAAANVREQAGLLGLLRQTVYDGFEDTRAQLHSVSIELSARQTEIKDLAERQSRGIEESRSNYEKQRASISGLARWCDTKAEETEKRLEELSNFQGVLRLQILYLTAVFAIVGVATLGLLGYLFQHQN